MLIVVWAWVWEKLPREEDIFRNKLMHLVTALATAGRKACETLAPRSWHLEDSEPYGRGLQFQTLRYLDGGLAMEHLMTKSPRYDGERESRRKREDLEVDVATEQLQQPAGRP